jgi:hypothetical protein
MAGNVTAKKATVTSYGYERLLIFLFDKIIAAASKQPPNRAETQESNLSFYTQWTLEVMNNSWISGADPPNARYTD